MGLSACAPEIDTARVAKYAPKQLFGRDAELSHLETALADPGTRVFSLIAFGGVGKTALMAHWLSGLAERGWPGLERVFGWSFYSQGGRDDGAASSDDFFAAAFGFFGGAGAGTVTLSAWDKGVCLAQRVAERRCLLVLDGLEPLQHPPGPLDGCLKDQAIAALLTTLAHSARNGAGGGLCLVTSREPVKELEGQATAREWRLEFLSDAAGAALLHGRGVRRAGAVEIYPDDAELRAASREMQGHALTLHILELYLAKAHGGDVRRRDTVALADADARYKTNPADRDKPYGHAFKVMAVYEKWLEQGGADGTRQLALLRLLGLFDRPADPGCLAALRAAPPMAGLAEPLAGLGAADWNIVVADLESAGLVQTADYAPRTVSGYGEEIARQRMEAFARRETFPLGEPEVFRVNPPTAGHCLDAHPLLRDYFARRLRETQPDAYREGHRRLFAHLQASVPYWPEGETGLQPLYQAVVHGCRAGLYVEALTVLDFRIGRFNEKYSTRKLGLFGAGLGAVAGFFDPPWSRLVSDLSEGGRAWLFSEAAFSLRALGRLSEALEPMRAGMEVTIQQEDWKNVAIDASNLSELELALGQVAVAVDDGGRSVDYADRSGDAFVQWGSHSYLANTLHQAGRRDKALKFFQEAEAIQAEWQPNNPLLYSLSGFHYCDALLAETDRAMWRQALAHTASGTVAPTESILADCRAVSERAARTLPIAERNNWTPDIARDHLTLARAALYAALLTNDATEMRQASTHATAAVDGLRAAGQQDYLPGGLLTRAWLHCTEGNPDAARADLDEAERIATRGGMRLHLADVHLHRARLFRDRKSLGAARRLIEDCGYGRRLKELADAEAAARAWD